MHLESLSPDPPPRTNKKLTNLWDETHSPDAFRPGTAESAGVWDEVAPGNWRCRPASAAPGEGTSGNHLLGGISREEWDQASRQQRPQSSSPVRRKRSRGSLAKYGSLSLARQRYNRAGGQHYSFYGPK